MKPSHISPILASTAILFGVSASSAAAAPVPTTLPATSVGATSAELNGTEATGGQATVWQFQFGRTQSYGQASAAGVIPAGQALVPVSSKVTGLKPATIYHFRLVSQVGTGSNYYPLIITFGGDRSFRTRTSGHLSLLKHKVSVANHVAGVPLKCVSNRTCKGKLVLTDRVRRHHHFTTVTVGRAGFKISGGKKKTVDVHLTGSGKGLLAAPGALSVNVTGTPSTGQAKLHGRLTLS